MNTDFWPQKEKIWLVPRKKGFFWEKKFRDFLTTKSKISKKRLNFKTLCGPAVIYKHCSFRLPLVSINAISSKWRTVHFFSKKSKNGQNHSRCQKYRYFFRVDIQKLPKIREKYALSIEYTLNKKDCTVFPKRRPTFCKKTLIFKL